MRALCLDDQRDLRLRDLSAPTAPPPGYVVVSVAAAAINPGDKTFLKQPEAAGGARGTRLEGIWGSSAAGTVTEAGDGVPERVRGRKVAVYRSLQPDLPFLGLWCETALVPYRACLLLPKDADPLAYSGSLVNVATAYAFVEQAVAEGHHGIVVTAGRSATGRAATELARRRGIPALVVVRSADARAALARDGVPHVLASDDPDFLAEFELAASDLGTTAIFDGVGGTLVSSLIDVLPVRSTIFFYGFLSKTEPVTFHSALFMRKDTTMRRFSNFDSPTVRDPAKLAAMLDDLEDCIGHPAFRTPVGQTFGLAEIDEALAHVGTDGRRAVLLPSA